MFSTVSAPIAVFLSWPRVGAGLSLQRFGVSPELKLILPQDGSHIYVLGGCDSDISKQISLNSKLNLLKFLITFDLKVELFTQFFNTIIFSYFIINSEGAISKHLVPVVVKARFHLGLFV